MKLSVFVPFAEIQPLLVLVVLTALLFEFSMQSRRSRAGAGGPSDHPHNTTLEEVDGVATTKTNKNTQWYTHPSIQWILQACTFLSLVSVCFNTPATFKVK